MVNTELATVVIPSSDCYSIIGPSVKVAFSDAAILWASFYHLMFSNDAKAMKREGLLKHCRHLARLYGIPLNYYSSSRSSKSGFRFAEINP